MKTILVRFILFVVIFSSPALYHPASAQGSSPDEKSDEDSYPTSDKQSEKQSSLSSATDVFIFTRNEERSIYADNASFYYELTIPKDAFECKTGNGSLEVAMMSADGVETSGTYAVTLKKCITKSKWGEGKFIKCKKYRLISGQNVLLSSASRTRKLPKKGSIMRLYLFQTKNAYYDDVTLNTADVSTKSGYPILPHMYEKGKSPR